MFIFLFSLMQFDYGGWMPNTPTSLQRPPPTTKGTTSEATMLEMLPDINTTVGGMAALWLLSKESSDFVSASESLMMSVCLSACLLVCLCHSHLRNTLLSLF